MHLNCHFWLFCKSDFFLFLLVTYCCCYTYSNVIVHLHENFCNAVYRIIFDHLTMFILANLRVGEFKISHIISYLVQQFKTGVKLFTSVEGREKNHVYSTFINFHNIFCWSDYEWDYGTFQFYIYIYTCFVDFCHFLICRSILDFGFFCLLYLYGTFPSS